MKKLSKLARDSQFIGSIIWHGVSILLNCSKLLPDRQFADFLYWLKRKGKLNLTNPNTFNEKLWWLKFHYRNPLQKICSDKYRAREYLEEIGEESLCVPLINYYTSMDQIKLEDFQEEVMFKLNIGSGANMLYDPKKPVDSKIFFRFFKRRMNHNYYLNSREWNFKGVQPIIIAEKVLRDSQGHKPVDYKFFCFDGIPYCVFCSEGVMDDAGRHSIEGKRFTNVYDMNWTLTEITSSYPRRPDIQIAKPEKFDQMKQIAAKLSKPFPHVRIDLYCIEGHIYLGEFTFYHSGGCGNISPDHISAELGNMINLEKIPAEYLE